jgi:hypothetical protein
MKAAAEVAKGRPADVQEVDSAGNPSVEVETQEA